MVLVIYTGPDELGTAIVSVAEIRDKERSEIPFVLADRSRWEQAYKDCYIYLDDEHIHIVPRNQNIQEEYRGKPGKVGQLNRGDVRKVREALAKTPEGRSILDAFPEWPSGADE